LTASVQSPADIVNLALSRAGASQRVGNLYEGSEFAKRALDVFGQTRDALLRQGDWGFPRRDLVLTLLKSAPNGGYVPGFSAWNPQTNPPRPYLFEYAYPADCMLLRALRPPTTFQPNFYPCPQNFEIANDTVPVNGVGAAPGRVILCYLGGALATYVGQVTDMTQWDIGFVEAMANEMARTFSAGRHQQGEPPGDQAYPGAVQPIHTSMRQG
jgi:hypothetical protein